MSFSPFISSNGGINMAARRIASLAAQPRTQSAARDYDTMASQNSAPESSVSTRYSPNGPGMGSSSNLDANPMRAHRLFSLDNPLLGYAASTISSDIHPNRPEIEITSASDGKITSAQTTPPLPTLPTEIKFMILKYALGDKMIKIGNCIYHHGKSRCSHHPFVAEIADIPSSTIGGIEITTISGAEQRLQNATISTNVPQPHHTSRTMCILPRSIIQDFSLNLLLANREMYQEGCKILYSTNVFSFSRTDHLERFVKKLRPTNRCYIRHIGLRGWRARLQKPYLSYALDLLPRTLETIYVDMAIEEYWHIRSIRTNCHWIFPEAMGALGTLQHASERGELRVKTLTMSVHVEIPDVTREPNWNTARATVESSLGAVRDEIMQWGKEE